MADRVKLTPYQERAIGEVMAKFVSKNGIVKIPVGFGKKKSFLTRIKSFFTK